MALPILIVTYFPRTRHHLHRVWPLQSVVGLVGSLLNGFICYTLAKERPLATCINALALSVGI